MTGYGAAGSLAVGGGTLAVTGVHALGMGLAGAVLVIVGLLLIRCAAVRNRAASARPSG